MSLLRPINTMHGRIQSRETVPLILMLNSFFKILYIKENLSKRKAKWHSSESFLWFTKYQNFGNDEKLSKIYIS
jgi:hypothetical protein